MSAKDSDKHQWSDPKDYGLPYVEITPIRSVSKPEPVQKLPVEAIGEAKESPEVPPAVEAAVVTEHPEKKEKSKPEPKVSTPPVNRVKEPQKSSVWVWAVVLIGLGIVSVIVWQIQSQLDSSPQEPVIEKTETPAVEPQPILTESVSDSTLTDQNQPTVNQDSISSINNSNPNISKPAQTGTTIANTASGNLIRIESKAERPQYFIIVGSLPNEKLAIEEAAVYFGRSPEVYLILPYDGGTNYRLAIGKFGSFKTAAEELERIKSQYTEALWILKY